MQVVWVLFVQVQRYQSLRFLFPLQFSGGEWNFICGTHRIISSVESIGEACGYNWESDGVKKTPHTKLYSPPLY